jgi:hydroxyethylthiazole kinase-like uncharacterized protein yjeF
VGDVVTPALLRGWPLPAASGGKHSRGDTFVVGGSPPTPGAAMLAGLAALRVGSGVLGLAVARSVAPAVAAAVPEAAVVGIPLLDGGDGAGPIPDRLNSANAVVVGPGLDDPDSARTLVKEALAHLGERTQLVADAFALGVLRDVGPLPARRAVLTPNSSEAARLLPDRDLEALSSEQVARAIAAEYSAVVSHGDAVADPDGNTWIVPSGHPGLGTSGSGDVLAGAIGGLLARGAAPAQAACWGTYLHAAAGDRLASRIGRLGFLARELVDELAAVLTETEA